VNPFLPVDFVQCIERSEMPWAKVRLAMEKKGVGTKIEVVEQEFLFQ